MHNTYLYIKLKDSDSGYQGSYPGTVILQVASDYFYFSAIVKESYYYLELSSTGRLGRCKCREEKDVDKPEELMSTLTKSISPHLLFLKDKKLYPWGSINVYISPQD